MRGPRKALIRGMAPSSYFMPPRVVMGEMMRARNCHRVITLALASPLAVLVALLLWRVLVRRRPGGAVDVPCFVAITLFLALFAIGAQPFKSGRPGQAPELIVGGAVLPSHAFAAGGVT